METSWPYLEQSIENDSALTAKAFTSRNSCPAFQGYPRVTLTLPVKARELAHPRCLARDGFAILM